MPLSEEEILRLESRVRNHVHNFCLRRRLWSYEDDLVQEALIKFHTKCLGVQNFALYTERERNILVYLNTKAAVIDFLRAYRREKPREGKRKDVRLLALDKKVLDKIRAARDRVEFEVMIEDLCGKVLLPKELEIILRYYWRGDELKDIAADWGVSAAKVSVVHWEALERLREEFGVTGVSKAVYAKRETRKLARAKGAAA